MKSLILLFALATSASAQQGFTNVHEVALTTSTIIQSIALGTTTTDVAAGISSGVVSGYFGVEVYNQSSSSSTIVCGFDPSLSTAVGNIWYGRQVPAGIGVYYGVGNNRRLRCAGTQASGTVPVTITIFK